MYDLIEKCVRVAIIEESDDCKCGRRHFIANEHPHGEFALVPIDIIKDGGISELIEIWARLRVNAGKSGIIKDVAKEKGYEVSTISPDTVYPVDFSGLPILPDKE